VAFGTAQQLSLVGAASAQRRSYALEASCCN
jgi:hypothetical protein